jgi:hypothetical protein
MAHKLFPREGQSFLSPEEIVARLREEFRYVEVDPEGGADHVGDMIAYMLRLNVAQAIVNELRQAQPRARRITVSDEATTSEWDSLHFVAIPDSPPFFGYHSSAHEQAVAPLLRRCAAALDYDIVLV